MKNPNSDDLITVFIGKFNADLGQHLKSDVITIKSPIHFGLDDYIRLEIENLHDDEKKRPNRLTVLLETPGGFIETVERIYKVFRNHYKQVDFIVPNYAYSAGTVLALSGDNIYMDYYSVLGPIDPQYESPDRRLVPGLGYLQKFEELVEHINSVKADADPSEYRAELAYLLKKFDPATLFHLEQARDHSISLLEDWLPKHKFASWKKTKTNGKRVTPTMRKNRAKEIAEILSDPKRWHSHGRGIGFKELTSQEIRLEIIDFGADSDLNDKVSTYYELLQDYCKKLSCWNTDSTVIHSQKTLKRIR